MGLRKKPPYLFFFFLLLIVWSAAFALSCCGLFRCYCSLLDRVHDCLLFFSLRNLLPLFFFSVVSKRTAELSWYHLLLFLHTSSLRIAPPFHPLPLSFFIPFISRDCLAFFFSFSHHMSHIALKTRPNCLLPSTSNGPFHISSRYTHLSDSIISFFFCLQVRGPLFLFLL